MKHPSLVKPMLSSVAWSNESFQAAALDSGINARRLEQNGSKLFADGCKSVWMKDNGIKL